MRRIALLAILAACGGKASSSGGGTEPPASDPVGEPTTEAPAPTCADVRDAARQTCVDQAWSAEMIACFQGATDVDSTGACMAAEVERSGLCAALDALVVAAHEDPPFDSAYGANVTGELFESTLDLNGVACHLDRANDDLFCQVSKGLTEAQAKDWRDYLMGAVAICLGADGWVYDPGAFTATDPTGVQVVATAEPHENGGFQVFLGIVLDDW